MHFRTPLANARGLGSAKQGLHHWWMQRITALTLIPLMLWILPPIVNIAGITHDDAVTWLQRPWHAILLLALIVAVFYHAILGLEVILEDYIHVRWLRMTSILAAKLVLSVIALAATVSVLRILLAGHYG